MGYRTSERLPLINAAPDNRGLYLDLYSEAAKRIGCELKVSRLPKKRILQGIQTGQIDFYPGFTYSPSRAKYVAFFENGLETRISFISSSKLANVTDLHEMSGKQLIVANGGATFGAEKLGVHITFIENLDLNRAINIIREGRADFYLYHRDTLLYYLKMNPSVGMRLHSCCGTSRPMHLGFSKVSKHFQAKHNPDYDPGQPISSQNDDVLPATDSVVARFVESIQQLKKEGTLLGFLHIIMNKQ
ncbi:substrate-binding periplasmic protein [Neptuniibacter sp. QD37_6]|uniref:substrate-binding periplasmic protein n=1 Tax=Neptuniibacter sp. QD37_6 TaxID=3398210 RepID=UPI0039F4AF3D